jgi:hypothetical protein
LEGPGEADLRGADGEARQEGGGAVIGWGLREDGATSSQWKLEGGCKEVCAEGREEGRTGK